MGSSNEIDKCDENANSARASSRKWSRQRAKGERDRFDFRDSKWKRSLITEESFHFVCAESIIYFENTLAKRFITKLFSQKHYLLQVFSRKSIFISKLLKSTRDATLMFT